MQVPQIPHDWHTFFQKELDQPYMHDLALFLQKERQCYPVFPSAKNVFQALALTPLEKVSVVIVGQDPYPNPGQAHGLAFSVPLGVPQPPSLKNIFRELSDDLQLPYPKTGSLEPWAQQGVLLLNTVLTVRAYEARSHQGKGWELFTDAILSLLSFQKKGLIFVLWGRDAQQKKRILGNDAFILEAAHPSPLSVRGFLGCRHFSKINEYLTKNNKAEINWLLP